MIEKPRARQEANLVPGGKPQKTLTLLRWAFEHFEDGAVGTQAQERMRRTYEGQPMELARELRRAEDEDNKARERRQASKLKAVAVEKDVPVSGEACEQCGHIKGQLVDEIGDAEYERVLADLLEKNGLKV